MANGQPFYPHRNQQTQESQQNLIWLAVHTAQHELNFFMAAILPHKINSRSHYRDFGFDLIRCYHSSVILLFYCSSKNKELISNNRPFKNNIVRYFVYFCSGSKNSSDAKLQMTELEHRQEERYKPWNIPVLFARSTNQISGLGLIAA